MSAEFRHPHHDPRRDICPFEQDFGFEYERPELRAFETRTRDMELAAIDFGEGEGKAERSDWYLMQGTRRSIRRAYESHREDPWAQAEPGSRAASIRSGLLRTVAMALRWARAAALQGSRLVAHREPEIQRVDPQDAATPQEMEAPLAPDPVSDELRLAQQRLANREAAFGFNHPDVASELHFIAALHHEAGQYATAVASYSMALAIRERTLGPDHPEVASTLEDLAAARRDDGEPEEADRLLARAQEIRRRRAFPAVSDPKRLG
jgi:tetratricopeptide (TPR) repeat protein